MRREDHRGVRISQQPSFASKEAAEDGVGCAGVHATKHIVQQQNTSFGVNSSSQGLQATGEVAVRNIVSYAPSNDRR